MKDSWLAPVSSDGTRGSIAFAVAVKNARIKHLGKFDLPPDMSRVIIRKDRELADKIAENLEIACAEMKGKYRSLLRGYAFQVLSTYQNMQWPIPVSLLRSLECFYGREAGDSTVLALIDRKGFERALAQELAAPIIKEDPGISARGLAEKLNTLFRDIAAEFGGSKLSISDHKLKSWKADFPGWKPMNYKKRPPARGTHRGPRLQRDLSPAKTLPNRYHKGNFDI